MSNEIKDEAVRIRDLQNQRGDAEARLQLADTIVKLREQLAEQRKEIEELRKQVEGAKTGLRSAYDAGMDYVRNANYPYQHDEEFYEEIFQKFLKSQPPKQ